MKKVKKILQKIKRPLCTVVFFLCLLLLLGCTGTADNGGNLVEYAIQGGSLLGVMFVAIADRKEFVKWE